MKRIILVVAILASLCPIASAQIQLKGNFGFNYSSLSRTSDGTHLRGNFGYQFGGSLLMGDKGYLEPGIQFVRNSRTYTLSQVGTEAKFKVDENLVKIPVHLGYHLLGDVDSPVALRVFAGPSLAIVGKIRSENPDMKIHREDFRNARWAMDVGLGVDILFLFVEANYEFGLTQYADIDGYNSIHDALVFNAGVRLPF